MTTEEYEESVAAEDERLLWEKNKSNFVKYYCWSYSKSYGWRADGNLEGYNSLEELKKDREYTLKNYPYKILKSIVIEEGEN